MGSLTEHYKARFGSSPRKSEAPRAVMTRGQFERWIATAESKGYITAAQAKELRERADKAGTGFIQTAIISEVLRGEAPRKTAARFL